ncbi:hypothetical protein BDF21DRAFT_415938 [Thamnidium elegans]|nr:hypothetical protein BDF21DRAFT_415938 [Thamnidium elegans]
MLDIMNKYENFKWFILSWIKCTLFVLIYEQFWALVKSLNTERQKLQDTETLETRIIQVYDIPLKHLFAF